MKPDSGKRIFYYDFLRVISALAVVWIHTSGISVGTQPVGSSAWLVSLFYDAGVHWAVPIFVMISGVLFVTLHFVFLIFSKKRHITFHSSLKAVKCNVPFSID